MQINLMSSEVTETPLCVCLHHLCIYLSERYVLIITPLLVHAQRRLLERISCFGGPAVPQPHHVKTHKATGKEVAHTHTQKHVQATVSNPSQYIFSIETLWDILSPWKIRDIQLFSGFSCLSFVMSYISLFFHQQEN